MKRTYVSYVVSVLFLFILITMAFTLPVIKEYSFLPETADANGALIEKTDGGSPEKDAIWNYKKNFRSAQKISPEIRQLVAGNNSFAVNLYQKLGSNGNGGNIFFSPYSISTALAMAWAGARNETATKMEKTLCFALPQENLHPAFHDLEKALSNRGKQEHDSGFRLNAANALWIQKDFSVLSGFLDILSLHYRSSPEYLDFGGKPEKSRIIINDWVSEHTINKINNILSPGMLSPTTKLVLTNAIYFEAKWRSPFVTAVTRDDDFFLADGNRVSVPMMTQQSDFGYSEGKLYKAVELPYRVNMSMVIVLPRPGFFDEFNRTLSPEKLHEIIDVLTWRSIILKLPKVDFESDSISLKKVLSEMGMADAFTEFADFSGIAPNLFIDKVIHKATVTVNEEGTVAAAATVVAMPTGLPLKKPIDFTVNRPFVFLIRDIETGAILFMGRIVNPKN